MVMGLLTKIFGTKSQRDVKRLFPEVQQINEIELSLHNLSDEELKAKTEELKERLANGEKVSDIMHEAYAVVKNACRRLCGTEITVCGHKIIWDMVPFDVQIMGGIVLNEGNIAEMATGEGKTLVATMPLYLNALTGKNCQLVTVSDYHALRDSEWMGAVYEFLGLTVGCIQNQMDPEERREQYGKDITYGTNSEFGFDYLRDMGMAMEKEQLVQRNHYFVIVDEVDSILIDEARTPLIISGPTAVSSHQFDKCKPLVANLYKKQSTLCAKLISQAKEILDNPNATREERDDAFVKLVQVKMGMPKHRQLMRMLEDGSILKQLEKVELRVKSDQNRGLLQEVQAELYFAIDERSHGADLTDKGRNEISPDNPDAFVIPDLITELHNIDSDSTLSEAKKAQKKQEFQKKFAEDSERIQNISQLINAYCLYEKDVNYVVQENKVMIVDEHTGRLMPGRRFNEGLHQALEAKENVEIERETQTFATITIQNYFRMYEKMAGMTGTAESESTEFHQIYKTDVVVIPTNKPCIRKDSNDCIYKTKRAKYKAIINEVEERHKKGQPVLLGTVSVDVSEVLSRMLKRARIPHNVLNAKNHSYEADIVARAGQMGAVTVATNMAGRGTDIKLGEGVSKLGGLHVIASERHDSRRIDRQLRGRCSRQGDPGSSKFYVSLEDNLMRLFGSDKVSTIMGKLGFGEDEELRHPLLSRSIEAAQKRVEQQYFAVRKHTLEFDDVMNKQREVVYGFRKDLILSENPKEILFDIVEDEINQKIDAAASAKALKETDFDSDNLLFWLNNTFPIGFTKQDLCEGNTDALLPLEKMGQKLFSKVENSYAEKEAMEEEENIRQLERFTTLEAVNKVWQDHLYAMDGLREATTWRSYAQKDPLVEYKHESFNMFADMMEEMNQQILSRLFRSATTRESLQKLVSSWPKEIFHKEIEQFGQIAGAARAQMQQNHPSQQMDDMDFEEPQIPTFRREGAKVGRNDPCPCGSGKKYKKCCGK